ncbi:MAG TPA: ribosomal protein S18-alanine N-acetyltransferase [Alphaproteobacteria bacterium]|nr:ribosomal protein S18-alanine N-acetyltransferase [Alphaproteobacteria bacterium]
MTTWRIAPVGASSAGLLAALHAAAFAEAWTASSLAGLMLTPGVFALLAAAPASGCGTAHPAGFILGRMAADECEILTLAVLPERRRRGVARVLLDAAIRQAREAGAVAIFLEVQADNRAARRLYESAGFEAVGIRRAYYSNKTTPPADALVLRLKPLDKSGANVDLPT